MTGLSGRVALVTGGAGSVGEQITRSLAAAGATVLVNCFHSYPKAKDLAAELSEGGADVRVLRASVARPEQVARMFEEVAAAYGRLDILVNNAAGGTFATLDELTDEHMDQAFATNVKGALWCARAARPLLARSDAGCVVNVSSLGATYAPANYLPIGVSKAGLEALTRYLAGEFAADGIRVNAASAGLMDNPVGQMFPEFESVSANTRAATPMGRLSTPEDLAGVVMMLASPQAGWVTGQTVVADGGFSLQRRATSPSGVDVRPPAPLAAELPPGEDPIAVVGMGLAVPGASSPEEFWRVLSGGAELFVEVPGDRWPIGSFYDADPSTPDKTYQRRSGFITDFTPHPSLAQEPVKPGDFTALWLRHSVFQALEGVARRDGDRYSVCVGYTPDGSQHLTEALIRHEVTGLAETAGDVRELLDLALPYGGADHRPIPHLIARQAIRGILPCDARVVMLDTACSSSLYAIDLGVRELLSGEADVALCGGSFALAPGGSVLFSKLQGLSRAGAVRALDKDADGVLFSDGAGVIVLKRLSRALADGDRVHGIIAGVGLSADGKGKAIYAPARAGQELAVNRALEKSGLPQEAVDWVIAHATGTPAGDEAEFLGLRDAYGGTEPVQVTSNKSLIGHTGWAAGVVSTIHALLALRHEVIPAQYRFSGAPESFGLDGTNLTIPREAVAWPRRADRPRTAAVSGFGFGGTNAHVLVQEYRPGRAGTFGYGRRRTEPPVIVGYAQHTPDGDAHSFGTSYPSPPFQKLRLPASTVRHTDRSQLMIVEVMQRLDPALRALCDRHRERVGVVVGHAGPTRNAVSLALRAHLDELDRASVATADPDALADVLKRLRKDAADRIGDPTEDSFPGEMPNVIAARLCNYFDLRGLNITVDGGEASLVDAFALASRYLEFGDIDVALVAGVNGNTLPSWLSLLGRAGPAGEGAFLFAVTRRDLAEAEGVPVLAEVG
jgi:3-oxoacyl-(acyl-carrier-protein) synthase/NAD(P)-dependent dehydrogenase (short-subunit alcohol dehydrogenase family)